MRLKENLKSPERRACFKERVWTAAPFRPPNYPYLALNFVLIFLYNPCEEGKLALRAASGKPKLG